ncbi:MAG TPA: hypothetical protein VKM54_22765 [Myxococcota bacterium]|nr:hypothetical protein [Myxococcota bacterium]
MAREPVGEVESTKLVRAFQPISRAAARSSLTLVTPVPSLPVSLADADLLASHAADLAAGSSARRL